MVDAYGVTITCHGLAVSRGSFCFPPLFSCSCVDIRDEERTSGCTLTHHAWLALSWHGMPAW